jgi:hypothetical protein
MVKVVLLAGLVAEVLSQCGWCREEPGSLAPTGDSWWLCQQAPRGPQNFSSPFRLGDFQISRKQR